MNRYTFENIIKTRDDIRGYNDFARKVCSDFCLRHCPSPCKSKYDLGFKPIYCDMVYHAFAVYQKSGASNPEESFCCDYNAERLCGLKNGK